MNPATPAAGPALPGPNETRLERATPADAAEILALQRLAYRSEAEFYGDYSIEPLTQTLDGVIRQFEDHVILKAVASGAIIGSVRGRLAEGVCHVGKLIVHPDHQNQGLGRSLMTAIESCFPAATRFELFTGSRSVKNLSLYQKLGYVAGETVAVSEKLSLTHLVKPCPSRDKRPLHRR